VQHQFEFCRYRRRLEVKQVHQRTKIEVALRLAAGDPANGRTRQHCLKVAKCCGRDMGFTDAAGPRNTNDRFAGPAIRATTLRTRSARSDVSAGFTPAFSTSSIT
jgi:hypothetical protein